MDLNRRKLFRLAALTGISSLALPPELPAKLPPTKTPPEVLEMSPEKSYLIRLNENVPVKD